MSATPQLIRAGGDELPVHEIERPARLGGGLGGSGILRAADACFQPTTQGIGVDIELAGDSGRRTRVGLGLQLGLVHETNRALAERGGMPLGHWVDSFRESLPSIKPGTVHHAADPEYLNGRQHR